MAIRFAGGVGKESQSTWTTSGWRNRVSAGGVFNNTEYRSQHTAVKRTARNARREEVILEAVEGGMFWSAAQVHVFRV